MALNEKGKLLADTLSEKVSPQLGDNELARAQETLRWVGLRGMVRGGGTRVMVGGGARVMVGGGARVMVGGGAKVMVGGGARVMVGGARVMV